MIDTKISKSQLATSLSLSSIFFICTISTTALNENLWDSIVSSLIAFSLNFVIAIPIFNLSENKINLSELIGENKKTRVILFLYIFYFLINDALVLLQTETLYSNTIHQNDEAILLVILVLFVSAYGCIKGIEPVCRAALIIFVISILSILLMYLGLVDFFDINNREIFLYNGFSDTINNSITIFTRSSILPQLAVLYTFVKRDEKTINIFAVFNFISMLVIISAFFMIVCTMGRFTLVQSYPIYSVFSFAKIEPFEGVDALFSLTWLIILCVKISLDLIAIKQILFYIGIKNKEKLNTFLIEICIFAIFYLLSFVTEFIAFIEIVLFVFIIVLGFIIPLYLILRGEKNGKNM